VFVNASEVFDGWREIPSANLGEVMVFTSDQIRGDDVADFLGALESTLPSSEALMLKPNLADSMNSLSRLT